MDYQTDIFAVLPNILSINQTVRASAEDKLHNLYELSYVNYILCLSAELADDQKALHIKEAVSAALLIHFKVNNLLKDENICLLILDNTNMKTFSSSNASNANHMSLFNIGNCSLNGRNMYE